MVVSQEYQPAHALGMWGQKHWMAVPLAVYAMAT